jgi:hypothetical protein
MFAAAATTALLAASPAVTAADPDGGAAWTARLAKAGSRGECVTVRRGAETQSRFCARLTRKAPFQYSVIYETEDDPQRWRTTFVVAFSRAVRSATLETPDGQRRYTNRRARILLVVLRGRVEQGELTTRVRVGGRTYTATAGRRTTAEVTDPLGETGWRTVPDSFTGTRRVCVAWERAPLRFGGTAPARRSGREHCGNARAAQPVAAAEHVGGRLVVLGLVSPRTTSVELRDGETRLPLAFDRRSHSYIAVLPDRATTGLTLERCAARSCVVAPVD